MSSALRLPVTKTFTNQLRPKRAQNALSNVVRRAQMSMWVPPIFENEPVKSYGKGSPERAQIDEALKSLKAKLPVEIPLSSGGKIINDKLSQQQEIPSSHKDIVANYVSATPEDVNTCINAALHAKASWENMPFEDRAAIYLRACELIAGKYRAELNAAVMLGQSKNAFQAEIDIVAETIDFIKYYVQKSFELYSQQPKIQTPGAWNKMVYRPLEGFVYAITPFNFTALAGTLVLTPSLLGNVVVWKPSPSALHSSWVLYNVLLEAGLPKDVIQFVPGDAVEITDTVMKHPQFSGLSYIGSTAVFKELLGKVGKATAQGHLKNYPRVVGETGAKNYHLVHSSADTRSAALNTIRAAFEYSGQKCSACSRVYVSESVWPEFKRNLIEETKKLQVGAPEQHQNFINAVIHRRSFEKLDEFLKKANDDSELELLIGGKADGSKGYFVYPTVYQTTNPKHEIMEKELFGPIVSCYVYPDNKFDETLKLIDSTSSYALTGSIFAKDQIASRKAQDALRHTAGNLYLNTKCTGSVVAQQPFGGARDSGTNDKTGTVNMLLRWVSMQTVKEDFTTLDEVLYPSNEV